MAKFAISWVGIFLTLFINPLYADSYKTYLYKQYPASDSLELDLQNPIFGNDTQLDSLAQSVCDSFRTQHMALSDAFTPLPYVYTYPTSARVIDKNYPLNFNCEVDRHVTDGGSYNRDQIATTAIVSVPSPFFEPGCIAGQYHTIDNPAGVISDIQLPNLLQSVCVDSCNYNLVPNQNLVTYVKPEISDQYGCSYAYNGNIYNCSYDAPVILSVDYVADGESCTADGASTPPNIPDPENIDLTPVVQQQINTNNMLEQILENTGIPDPTNDIDNNQDLLNVHGKIEEIKNGTYKPFGDGFTTSLFPHLPSTTGSCFTVPVIQISGHTFDINTEMFCEIQAIFRSMLDFMFFIMTWFFIFYLWRDAIREIA